MCTPSDTLKFCSCKVSSVNRLQNYWALYRRNKDKNIIIVGEVLLPNEWSNPDYDAHYKRMLVRVNQEDVFDIPLSFTNGDVLEIVCNNKHDEHRRSYGFRYSKKRWAKHEIDAFHLMGHFDQLHFGRINKR